MSDSTKAIYVTDQFGPSRIYDEVGEIGRFQDTKNNVAAGPDGINRRIPQIKNIWVMVLDDPELIQRAEARKDFGSKYKRVDSMPVFNVMSNLKTVDDPNRHSSLQTEVDKLSAEKEQIRKESRRYAELYNQICKAGGEYLANADPELVAEFESLKLKIGE